MAKDKRIAEFPGISQSAIVALSRIGILTASDLINADYERVAVVLDDFNEAARLVREARKFLEARAKAKEAPTPPAPPAPQHIASSPVASAPRSSIRIGSSGSGPRHKSQPQQSTAVVGQALSLAAGAIQDNADWRQDLLRRLDGVRALLEHDAKPVEVAAVLLLEGVEAGTVEAGQLGGELETLIEECVSLRAVPTLPSGKVPKYYTEMAAKASDSARRVCAALLTAAGGGGDGAERLAEALLAGEPDPVVDRVEALFGRGRQAA
jgi:hypothetical protein